ncbi:hypothetical protein BDN70DRAFT_233014 [Pholiota conissans]|uniref:ABM domain-containing protein n=1 Tax=Pholiota conissans TaxID=109636 RepID=A0A9P5YUX2_9AGAR|nr:hypothetical protein BDN70DRAFT_233014 [Pholiota conissans]
MSTATCGSLVPLASQEGKGDAVAEFLLGGYGLVQAEPETLQWYAMKLEGTSPPVYDIFDTFPSQEGRKAHFDGPIPNALMQHGPSLLSVGPDINKIMVEVIASKVTKAGEGQKAGLTVGSRVLFTAKPEKKEAVRESLVNALAQIKGEEKTVAWYAIHFPGTDNFGAISFFASEEDRLAHLKGPVVAAAAASAEEVLVTPPASVKFEILAAHVTNT